MVFDTCCMSVKNKKEPNIQCPSKRKEGDYCGVHARCKNITRIDSNSHTNNQNQPLNLNQTLNHNLMDDDTTIMCKKQQPTEEQNANININITKEPLFYDNLEYITSLSYDDIKYDKLLNTLKHLNLQISGSKSQIIENLCNNLKQKEKIKEVYDNLDLCNNNEDFHDFVNLHDVPKEYLFIFYCADKRFYGMDLRSMNSYFTEIEKDARISGTEIKYINPYNRQRINGNIINEYRVRIEELKKKNMPLTYTNDEQTISAEEKVLFHILTVFQIIATYQYSIDSGLFTKLAKPDLLHFYAIMEDYWNTPRRGLNLAVKRNLVPDDPNLFNRADLNIICKYNLTQLQEFIISKIEKLITSGADRETRIHGIHLFLHGLHDVNRSENLLN